MSENAQPENVQPENIQPVLLTDEVRELIALIKDSDIAEVLIERGDAKLHIKRALSAPVAATPAVVAPPPAAPQVTVSTRSAPLDVAVEAVPDGVTISAPMVGTFFSSPSPKDPPYIQLGDEVKPGDVLGIIEAMKIMNEIECEVHGRVTQIMAQNAQPVEYGQALMMIELIDGRGPNP